MIPITSTETVLGWQIKFYFGLDKDQGSKNKKYFSKILTFFTE